MKITGLEGTSDYRLPNGLGVRFAASYAKGTARTAGLAGSAPLDSIEPFKFVGGVFFQPQDGAFRAEVTATHSAGKSLSDVNNSACTTATIRCFTPAGFWTFDATAAYRFAERSTVRVGLFNITDEKYFWYSDVRGLAVTSTVRDAYSEPGRNAGVSLSLGFW